MDAYTGTCSNVLPIFRTNRNIQNTIGRLGLTENVSISGDTRFDRVIAIAENAEPLPSIASFCGQQPVIVAGSTWEEDEEELDHYANTHPEIRIIIARTRSARKD